jgi:RimJ/RimL family protein N-acetyltransferase
VPHTNRMTLHRTNWPDVDDVVAMTTDPEVMRYFQDSLPLTPARVLAEEMPRLMAHNRRKDQLGFWVARDRGTGDFLGWFMLTPVDQSVRTVKLGYRLRRQAWGKGYGAEGVLQMIEMARAAQMLTVIATTLGVHGASRRVMEKAGLRPSRAGIGEATGPMPVVEHWEIVYPLELSEAAALSA